MNYWLFTTKRQPTKDGKRFDAIGVVKQRLKVGFWGLAGKAPKEPALKKGDKVVFYLCSPEKAFAASTTLTSGFRRLSHKEQRKYGKDFEAKCGVFLKTAKLWEAPLNLNDELVKNLKFITNKKNWGSFIQGGVRQIKLEDDFRTIVESKNSVMTNSASAVDIPDELPKRLRTQTSRLIRNTTMVQFIKNAHAHTCQVCGKPLELLPGIFYSEGHHLKPLGRPHNGPDVKENILCVCPNCHVKLDFAVTRIEIATLRLVRGHSIRQEFIDYHNQLWSGRQINK